MVSRPEKNSAELASDAAQLGDFLGTDLTIAWPMYMIELRLLHCTIAMQKLHL